MLKSEIKADEFHRLCSFVLVQLGECIGEGREGSPQNAVDVGDRHTVIGHGSAAPCGKTGAHLHFSLAVGDKDFMVPGMTGWKPLGQLPMVDPCKYLSGYSL